MQEVHLMCVQWKEEAVVWHEAWVEEAQWAEEVQRVKEECQVTPSMSFKPTRLLGGEVVLDKVKEKVKAHPLVHVPDACVLAMQCKVSVGLLGCHPDKQTCGPSTLTRS